MAEKRVVLKLSGEFFTTQDDSRPIAIEAVREVAKNLLAVRELSEIAVVIGGGNLWRGVRRLSANPCLDLSSLTRGQMLKVCSWLILGQTRALFQLRNCPVMTLSRIVCTQ